jgi:hypothetical protein
MVESSQTSQLWCQLSCKQRRLVASDRTNQRNDRRAWKNLQLIFSTEADARALLDKASMYMKSTCEAHMLARQGMGISRLSNPRHNLA